MNELGELCGKTIWNSSALGVLSAKTFDEHKRYCPSEARTHDLPMIANVTVGRCDQLSHGALNLLFEKEYMG